MSKIKKIDILKFLDGSMGSKKKEAIRTWAYESVENAQDLAFTQKIYKESDNLKTFNPVDPDLEWSAFKGLLDSSPDTLKTEESKSTDLVDEDTDKVISQSETAAIPSDIELLNYLEGNAMPDESDRVTRWYSAASDNKDILDFSDSILKESTSLASFKQYDVDSEWNLFKTKVSAYTPESNIVTMRTPEVTTVASQPHIEQRQEQPSRSILPLWTRYAAAAALALLIGAYMWTSTEIFRSASTSDYYAEYATQFNTHEINMIDGSRIFMGQNTTIRYPETLDNLDERRLYLDGQGQFDVASNEEKPFIVEISDEIGIRVIGTIFKVFAHEDFVEAVENIEGKVRAYSLKDTSIYVDLGPGDRYGWDGAKFVDMNAKDVVDNSIEYDMLYVLDYLMANSSWKVISSPNMPFDESGVVKIDLDKNLIEILEDLRDRSDFDYIELNCDNCYQITRFKELDN